jgi:uncharacterized protein (DUF433 family)
MMNHHEFAANGCPSPESKRVVEAEIKLPTWEDLDMPKVDLEPARRLAEDILLTGLGAMVLAGRGLSNAVRAANQAGAEAAEHPGPLADVLLKLVRKPGATSTGEGIRVQVPILPIDNYDERSPEEILAHLPKLSEDQLRVLRDYEMARARRTTILKAIDRQLGVA